MSDVVISVENLSKRYLVGHNTAKTEQPADFRELISRNVSSLARKTRDMLSGRPIVQGDTVEEFWALNDVSFDIQQGDRVGIIGRNGAGKSTLLKILSRITEPTSGRVSIRGRVASLLEVGTGFHPDLTGRENIFLNGAILGMSKAAIKNAFDEIVAFAEVEKFLDTPVKRYSSGMYVRLAFSVAAHLEPEILIVDEVLAVGDAQFQRKCIGRMNEVSRHGKTILFVSHNLSAIQRLCNKGILLESGKVKNQGAVSIILSQYMQTVPANDQLAQIAVKPFEVKFVSWALRDASPDMPYSCYSRDECEFEFKLVAKRAVNNAVVGFAIWSSEGVLVFATSSKDSGKKYLDLQEGIHRFSFKVRLAIKADTYQLDVSMNEDNEKQADRWLANIKLVVLPRTTTSLPQEWHGLLNEVGEFRILTDIDSK